MWPEVGRKAIFDPPMSNKLLQRTTQRDIQRRRVTFGNNLLEVCVSPADGSLASTGLNRPSRLAEAARAAWINPAYAAIIA